MATNPSTRMRRHESKFVLVWAGDDIANLGYGGSPVALPPVDVVSNPGAPNSPYRYPAAEDEAGPIPGTVVLKSVIVHDHNTGGLRPEFDATDWCDGIETTELGKKFIARGFSILDGYATRADIKQAQDEGRPKWERAQEAQWNDVISREMSRRDKLKQSNRPITAATNEKAIREAMTGLAMLQRSRADKMVSDSDLAAAIGLAPKPAPATVTPFPVPAAIGPEKETKALDGMAERLLAIAQKHNVRLKNDEVMGLVKRDEGVMSAVEAKLTEAGVDLVTEFGA
jgi:hypothetical protein